MWSLLFIVFAIVGGIIQIIVAIISKSNKQKMLGNSPTAIGTVTDYNSHLGFSNTTTYYPIIAFRDASGQNFQVDSAEGAIWKAYKIGETLEIFGGVPSQYGEVFGVMREHAQGDTLAVFGLAQPRTVFCSRLTNQEGKI